MMLHCMAPFMSSDVYSDSYAQTASIQKRRLFTYVVAWAYVVVHYGHAFVGLQSAAFARD